VAIIHLYCITAIEYFNITIIVICNLNTNKLIYYMFIYIKSIKIIQWLQTIKIVILMDHKFVWGFMVEGLNKMQYATFFVI